MCDKNKTQQPDVQATDNQKLEKKELEKVPGGSYDPDTEPKDDDILLPEL